MIKIVIRFKNNMVVVCDEEEEQIPEYQAQYEEVKEFILEDAPLNAVFGYLSDFQSELRKVTREEW